MVSLARKMVRVSGLFTATFALSSGRSFLSGTAPQEAMTSAGQSSLASSVDANALHNDTTDMHVTGGAQAAGQSEEQDSGALYRYRDPDALRHYIADRRIDSSTSLVPRRGRRFAPEAQPSEFWARPMQPVKPGRAAWEHFKTHGYVMIKKSDLNFKDCEGGGTTKNLAAVLEHTRDSGLNMGHRSETEAEKERFRKDSASVECALPQIFNWQYSPTSDLPWDMPDAQKTHFGNARSADFAAVAFFYGRTNDFHKDSVLGAHANRGIDLWWPTDPSAAAGIGGNEQYKQLAVIDRRSAEWQPQESEDLPKIIETASEQGLIHLSPADTREYVVFFDGQYVYHRGAGPTGANIDWHLTWKNSSESSDFAARWDNIEVSKGSQVLQLP